MAKGRVVYLHYGIFEGGDSNGWYRTFELAKGLAALGWEVDLLTTGARVNFGPLTEKELDGVNVKIFGCVLPERFQRGGFSFSTIVRKMQYVFRASHYDFAIADNIHRPTCLLPALTLRLTSNILVISEWWELFGLRGIYTDLGWSHRLTVGLYDLLLEKTVRKRCDGIVAISSFLAKEAMKLGFKKTEIEVLHAGISQSILRKPYQTLSKSELRIGLIGFNRDELINNSIIFEAALELHEAGKNIKIVCSGKKSLQSIIPKKFEEITSLLGWVGSDEFVDAFNSCHLLALMQEKKVRNEARFPNKFGDYMGFSGIVITNAIGDIAEYVNVYPQKVVFAETKEDVKRACLRILAKGMPHHPTEIRQSNSWLCRAKQLERFIQRF